MKKTIWTRSVTIKGVKYDFIYSFDSDKEEYILESFKNKKRLFSHTILLDTLEMTGENSEYWGDHFLKDAERLISEKIIEKK
jgi:hypothetical protein